MNYGDFYRSFETERFYIKRGWMIGSGRIGGKAKGLSFAHHILEKNGLLEDVHMPEYSFAVTTSEFDEFMEMNGLRERLESRRCVFESIPLPDAARAAGDVNGTVKEERCILVGPGRWGSSNPLLGVPVRYNEISNSGCLVELGIPHKGMTPELSYGTHFFPDLEVDGVLYMPVFAGEDRNIFNSDWFEDTQWEKCANDAVRIYRGNFAVYMDGETNRGIIVDNGQPPADE